MIDGILFCFLTENGMGGGEKWLLNENSLFLLFILFFLLLGYDLQPLDKWNNKTYSKDQENLTEWETLCVL